MAITGESVYGKKDEKPISQEVPLPDVEKKEQYNMNRRTFSKISAGLAAAFVTEEATIGALRKYLLGETSGSQTGAGAITDPHVVEATFGGYNIKGDTEGYGFKAVNPKGMGISPGGKAEIVGIIENGKGIVYMDKEGAQGADVIVNKGGFVVDQWDLFPVLPELNEQGLIKAQLDLNKLKEEYGLNAGDGIDIRNAENKKYVFTEFLVQ